MPKIDLTPTRAESARICAYVLCTFADMSPFDLGDYWNYTEAEEEMLFRAYKDWDAYVDFWTNVGVELVDLPASHKRKAARACIERAKGDN